MKKKSLLVNIVLTICMFVTMLGFSGCGDTSKKMKTTNFEITDSFTNISIDTVTSGVHVLYSEGESTGISCYEYKKVTHTAEVVDDTLVIKMVDERKWYDKILNFSTPHISITLPGNKDYGSLSLKTTTGDVYVDKKFQFESINIKVTTGDIQNYASASGDITLKASTGDVRMEDVSAGSVKCDVTTGDIAFVGVQCAGDICLDSTTGKISLQNINCKNLTTDGTTGDVFLYSVLAEEKFYIEATTGDVKFDRCDAAEIEVKVGTGDVKGNLRSSKIFVVNSNTGKINVPESTTGGKCKITTNTGDIKITFFEE